MSLTITACCVLFLSLISSVTCSVNETEAGHASPPASCAALPPQEDVVSLLQSRTAVASRKARSELADVDAAAHAGHEEASSELQSDAEEASASNLTSDLVIMVRDCDNDAEFDAKLRSLYSALPPVDHTNNYPALGLVKIVFDCQPAGGPPAVIKFRSTKLISYMGTGRFKSVTGLTIEGKCGGRQVVFDGNNERRLFVLRTTNKKLQTAEHKGGAIRLTLRNVVLQNGRSNNGGSDDHTGQTSPLGFRQLLPTIANRRRSRNKTNAQFKSWTKKDSSKPIGNGGCLLAFSGAHLSLHGVRFTNCHAVGANAGLFGMPTNFASGGGAIAMVGGKLDAEDVIFEKNTAEGEGGAVSNTDVGRGCSAKFSHARFTGNVAGVGAGAGSAASGGAVQMKCSGSIANSGAFRFAKVEFAGNEVKSAYGQGGALDISGVESRSLVVQDALFYKNTVHNCADQGKYPHKGSHDPEHRTCRTGGGAVHVAHSSKPGAVFKRAKFVENVGFNGGGVYFHRSEASLLDVVFSGNKATTYGKKSGDVYHHGGFGGAVFWDHSNKRAYSSSKSSSSPFEMVRVTFEKTTSEATGALLITSCPQRVFRDVTFCSNTVGPNLLTPSNTTHVHYGASSFDGISPTAGISANESKRLHVKCEYESLKFTKFDQWRGFPAGKRWVASVLPLPAHECQVTPASFKWPPVDYHESTESGPFANRCKLACPSTSSLCLPKKKDYSAYACPQHFTTTTTTTQAATTTPATTTTTTTHYKLSCLPGRKMMRGPWKSCGQPDSCCGGSYFNGKPFVCYELTSSAVPAAFARSGPKTQCRPLGLCNPGWDSPCKILDKKVVSVLPPALPPPPRNCKEYVGKYHSCKDDGVCCDPKTRSFYGAHFACYVGSPNNPNRFQCRPVGECGKGPLGTYPCVTKA